MELEKEQEQIGPFFCSFSRGGNDCGTGYRFFSCLIGLRLWSGSGCIYKKASLRFDNPCYRSIPSNNKFSIFNTLLAVADSCALMCKPSDAPRSSYQVFLSYQWHLQDTVKILKSKIEERGFQCWMDNGEMGGGDALLAEIDAGIQASKVRKMLLNFLKFQLFVQSARKTKNLLYMGVIIK